MFIFLCPSLPKTNHVFIVVAGQQHNQEVEPYRHRTQQPQTGFFTQESLLRVCDILMHHVNLQKGVKE